MIRTLIRKEIQEKIYSTQFVIIILLCITLIPLGMFVSMKSFEKQQIGYMEHTRQYLNRSQQNVGHNFRAEGYRPPSALIIFSEGLGDYLPFRVVTDRDKGYTVETALKQSNLISILFGRIDFTLIVTSFLSVLSIIFTFSCVTSEKESGTIRLVFSNSIQRWKVATAKILGNYILFCIPFFVSVIIGLLILQSSPYISVFQPDFLWSFLLICFTTLLLILLLFNLGFFISTVTSSSLTSVIILLFVWVFSAFFIPKVSPMIAQIVYPIDAEEVFETKKKTLIEDMEQEHNNKLKNLYEQKLSAYHVNIDELNDLFDASTQEARKEYDIEKTVLDIEFQERFQSEVSKFDKSYYDNQQTQYSISRKIARISPISSYISLMSEVCHTGFSEIENFRKQAAILQLQVQEGVYSNWTKQRYAAGGRTTEGYFKKDKTLKEQEIPVPEFKYNQLEFKHVINYIWVDFLFIFFFCILFFLLGFINFLRYDVR